MSLPTRRRHFPSAIKGRWTIKRVLMSPLCGGMCARGRRNENSTDSERFGMLFSGTYNIALTVFGQRAAFTPTNTPFFLKVESTPVWIIQHAVLIVVTAQTIGVAFYVRPESGVTAHHLAQFIANPVGIGCRRRHLIKLSRVKKRDGWQPRKIKKDTSAAKQRSACLRTADQGCRRSLGESRSLAASQRRTYCSKFKVEA